MAKNVNIGEIGKRVGEGLLTVIILIGFLAMFGVYLMPVGCWYLSFWLSALIIVGFPTFFPRNRGSDAEREV